MIVHTTVYEALSSQGRVLIATSARLFFQTRSDEKKYGLQQMHENMFEFPGGADAMELGWTGLHVSAVRTGSCLFESRRQIAGRG